MLPDGVTVLFTVAKSSGSNRWDEADIVTQRINGGGRQTLIRGGSDARYLPSGHIVYAVGGTVFAVPFDVRRTRIVGPPIPVIEGVRRAAGATTASGAGTAQLAISATGSLVYLPGPTTTSISQRELVMFDRSGGLEPLKLPKNSYEFPRLSPDGKQVAFGTEDKDEKMVWVYDLSGVTAPRRLTFGGRNQYPIWSADGQWIIFQTNREPGAGIFRQRADGTGVAERLTLAERGTSHVPESFSPDGDSFSLTIVADPGNTLALYSLRERKLTSFPNLRSLNPFNSAISPDGRWIAYTWRAPGDASIQVQPIPPTGARHQVSKNDSGHHPFWSRDGKELFYQPGAGPLTSVRVTTQPVFATSDPMTVNPLFTPTSTPFTPRNQDITEDGRRFIAAVDRQMQTGATAPQIQVVLNWTEELKQRVPTK